MVNNSLNIERRLNIIRSSAMPKVMSETLQMAIPTRAIRALYSLSDTHCVFTSFF
jgi:hypothetical protein